MGQLVTTIAGGVIGFMIGGPFGAQIGMMLGGMIGATLFGPTVKGPRLTDLKVSASTYGIAIPEIYGTVRIAGNMIWTTGIKETKKTHGAGKGGPKTTTYTYDATFAVALCKGTIDGVLRVWGDSKLIYDSSGSASSRAPSDAGSATSYPTITNTVFFGSSSKKKPHVNMRVYKGTEDQLPDSLMEADKGAGNVSAHRGIAYVVFEHLQLEDFGNRIPQLTFEVTKSKATTFPSVKATIDGTTAIPDVFHTNFAVDWESGRVLMRNFNGTTYVADLNTMQTILQGTMPAFPTRETIVQGANLIVGSYGVSNDQPLDYYDLTSLTKLKSVGENSTHFSRYCPVGPSSITLGLGNLGCIGAATSITESGTDYVIGLVTWTKDAWVLSGDGTPIGLFRAPWVPLGMFGGKTGTGQLIGWRSSGGYLQVMDFNQDNHSIDYQTNGDQWWTENVLDLTVNIQPFAGEAFVPYIVLYDPTDDHIFCLGASADVACAFKYSLDTGSYKFAVKHPGLLLPASKMGSSRLAGGTFGWIYARFTWVGHLSEIDLQTGELINNVAYGRAWGDQLGVDYKKQSWDDVTSSLVCVAGGFRRIFFRTGLSKVTLPGIVEDICLRSGVLSDTDIDTSALDGGAIVGYVVDRECTGRDALKQLATAYLFDCYESDYMLKFRSRGDASQVTIDQSWITRGSDGTMLKETLTQELEMSLKITVNYNDVTRDYQQGTQSAKRNANPFPTMWTTKEDIIDLPIAWMPDDAKQCADKLLKMAWANRTGYQFQLPFRYLKYDPTDVITVTLDSGTTYSLRLTDLNIGADFQLEAKAVSEKAAAYVSTAVGNAGIAPEQNLTGPFTAYPMIINTPLLRDADYDSSDMSLCYLSAGTAGLTFGTTAIYMDDGIDYRSVGVIDSETVSGYTISILPYITYYEATDETSVLKVRLSDPTMELESITQDTMLNSAANGALVGDEVIQFRDATLQTNGEWWLTGLRRARRGTNYALRNHTKGERFLLLDAAALASFARPPETYVTTRAFKAVPTGTLVEDATPYRNALVPRDLMPYTPEDVAVTDDGTTATVTMNRRCRIIAPLHDGSAYITYKEGDKASAKITWKMWAGLGISDTDTVLDPTASGSIPLFDSSGNDIAADLTFPLTDLGVETTCLIRLTEVGVVEGIPKWIAFERIDQNRWNQTEFY